MTYRPFYVELRGKLKNESPLHIGTGEGWNAMTDNPVLRSHDQGREQHAVIPGASLKGVLRACVSEQLQGAGRAVVNSLFGSASENEGARGRVTIWDAVVTQERAGRVRDHVRMEGNWGAAAEGAKFDEEVVEAGAAFDFRCVYEGDGEEDAEWCLLRSALKALRSGKVRVGAGAGRGYGRLKLKVEHSWKFDRRKEDELGGYVRHRLERDPVGQKWAWDGVAAEGGDEDADGAPRLVFRVEMQLEGPTLVKASLPPEPAQYPHADHIYQSMGAKAYVPGSSIRGVLRRRAEQIAGAVLDKAAGAQALELLFGSKKESKEGKKGRLEFEDGAIAEARPIYVDHVALDRITGFVAGGKKFAVVALESPQVAVTVRLRMGREGREDWKLALALWAMVLRDVRDGHRLSIGSGRTKGFGWVTGAEIEIGEEGNAWGIGAGGKKDLDWLWTEAGAAWQVKTAVGEGSSK